MFNLYHGHDARKNYGVQARQRNARLLARQQANASASSVGEPSSSAASAPASKAHVAVPSFRKQYRPSEAEIAEAQLASVPRRKPGELIAQELAEQQELDERAAPPVATKALLDDHEKERCAALMQHRGKLPQLSPAQEEELRRRAQPPQPVSKCAAHSDCATQHACISCRSPGPCRAIATSHASHSLRTKAVTSNPCALHISGRCLQCRLQELQGLFSSVSEEIASREAFMAEMQRCRRPKRDYEHVRLEIADRLQELRKLDAMIAAEAQQQQKAQPQS